MTLALPSGGATKVITYPISSYATQTTTLTWTCTVNPSSKQVVELGQTATFNVNCPQPSWVYVMVVNGSGTLFSGETNYQVYSYVGIYWSGFWYVAPLPGQGGYIWGGSSPPPSNYIKCYFENNSLPSIGSNPPQYYVTNGSRIKLYLHCLPGTGTVYWVVNVQNPSEYEWWDLTDSYGHHVTGSGSRSGSFAVNGSDTLTLTLTTIWWSGVRCTINSPNPQTVNPGQMAVFYVDCTSSSGGGGSGGGGGGSSPTPTSTTTSTTTTTSTPPPSKLWNIYVSVTDNYGAGYIITDSYGNSLQAAVSLSNVLFATFNSSHILGDILYASIQFTSNGESCTISPSSTTVSVPSSGNNVYVSFTVSCGSGTSSPTPTPTPTSTPPPSPTSTPTSTTSSPPPTSPTSTFTSGTPVTTPTSTTIELGCAGDGSNIQVGQAGVFECWYAWNGFTPVSITAAQGVQQVVASEVATFYYMKGSSQQYPDVLVGGPWQASGHCPYG